MKLTLFLVLSLGLVAAGVFAETASPSPEIMIKVPSKDAETGCRVIASGKATTLPGQHLWIYAARGDYADLGMYWQQGEAKVDPISHEYALPITLGIAADTGSFNIAAILVDEDTHSALKSRFVDAMMHNQHLPMQLPATIIPPQVRTVKKTSREGC